MTVKARNPFIVRTDNGSNDAGDRNSEQPQSTRLVVSNIPLSYSDTEILEAIKKLGVTVFSKLIAECDRDESGKLTHWKTGRRFIYIAVPKIPLPKTVEMGPFRASLYHKEQKLQERQQDAVCGRCLEKGHKAAFCLAPIKCRQCLQEGHKAGEAACSLTPLGAEDSSKSQQSAVPDNATAASTPPDASKKTTSDQEKDGKMDTANIQPEKGGASKDRGRPRLKSLDRGQTTLRGFRRDTSGSLKRKPRDSSWDQTSKLRRLQQDHKEADTDSNNEADEAENGWG